jgi:hypothetical protein
MGIPYEVGCKIGQEVSKPARRIGEGGSLTQDLDSLKHFFRIFYPMDFQPLHSLLAAHGGIQDNLLKTPAFLPFLKKSMEDLANAEIVTAQIREKPLPQLIVALQTDAPIAHSSRAPK